MNSPQYTCPLCSDHVTPCMGIFVEDKLEYVCQSCIQKVLEESINLKRRHQIVVTGKYTVPDWGTGGGQSSSSSEL